ncbi:hypothetical protein FGG08_004896 [Glutinoglossum americanum]|uniref:Tetratricopeptide repeat and J domain-containing co-chaperone DNJ1 n=1 Tax=Glutinoglossum americanum TaxID=1670608 RepID=A0A9P8I898_9PEZI|nr:hypothetical protein FGG08_004896 [Glutinoglossum americanum]
MIIRFLSLAFTVTLLSSVPFALCLSTTDIPNDTPVSSLVSSANALLAQGDFYDALTYFDVAISRDPQNYLTIFKRGATYLSLGKHAQATQDFDKVLTIKPDFEGALLQRAKIKARKGDWTAAINDYLVAGKTGGHEIAELEEARDAARNAVEAEKQGDWEGCVSHAGVAIMTASTVLRLRQLRARCRFEKGEVHEAVADLAHALQISSESIEPHLQISATMFYSMADPEKALAQVRRCLHSDPDSKPCSKLFRREKVLDKTLNKIKQLMEKRQFNSASKLLVGARDDVGLIQDVKDDIIEFKGNGYIHKNSPEGLLYNLFEITCEAYSELKNHKNAQSYCDETLTHNPNSLPALLAKASRHLDAEDFEACIQTLNHAKEHSPGGAQHPRLTELLNKAHILLKRSKQKDYYKVLGVSRDADDRDIKRAYRELTKQYHPDKVAQLGGSKEDAEKKMAGINEAYEVLSDPELRQRFDSGDDPNSQEGRQQHPFHGNPFGGGSGQQYFYSGGGGFPGGAGGGGFKFEFPGGFQFP